MNWIDVAKILAPLAPAAGSILGGFIPFPGASLIGQQFGTIIARQFGVPATPAAVGAAIKDNPNDVVLAKITQATEIARAEIEGFTEIEKAWAEVAARSVAEVNATMRAERGHEHWFFTGWRPAAGWVLVINAMAFGAMLCLAAAQGAFFGSPEPLKILVDAWPIFLAYFGALGMVVGVYVIARTQDKVKAMEAGTTATAPVKPVGKK